ncbi:MAG: VaFE repeat-containing surface-anchored protein, partial [Nakamurella sp.]
YTASGEFQIVKDGKATASGIKGTATFTPKSAVGDVKVEFKVPADLSKHLGETWVAFETVKQGDVTVAIHADVMDQDQTVYVPKVGTTARNGDKDLGKTVVAGGTLVDTIAYENLTPGKQYTAAGEFMAMINDKPVPTGVVGTATFTPKAANGTVDVQFKVPADLKANAGHSWVAFETVKQGSVIVAIHADVTDQAQTVWAPKIGTSLYGPNKENGPRATVDAQGGVTLVDTIGYQGLQPGQKYVATGEIMFNDGKSTGITSSQEFTADKADGTVDVKFNVPGDLLDQGSVLVVAYESVALASKPGTPVATHQDLNAESQQLVLSFGSGAPAVPNSGGGGQVPSGLGADGHGVNPALVGGGIALLLLLAGVGIFLANRRRRQDEVETD